MILSLLGCNCGTDIYIYVCVCILRLLELGA